MNQTGREKKTICYHRKNPCESTWTREKERSEISVSKIHVNLGERKAQRSEITWNRKNPRESNWTREKEKDLK